MRTKHSNAELGTRSVEFLTSNAERSTSNIQCIRRSQTAATIQPGRAWSPLVVVGRAESPLVEGKKSHSRANMATVADRRHMGRAYADSAVRASGG
jgi:hypothetical protein